MGSITGITKRDIYELFSNGMYITGFEDTTRIKYQYFGRLNEIDFLKKLYPLDTMPSLDSRFENAEGEIWQHTVNNDDYEFCWFFEDERFGLLNGSDDIILKFLCEVFHPESRLQGGCWKEYLEVINSYIKIDGYELYESDKISNRSVYSWRSISLVESQTGRFAPFSIRHKKSIENKTLYLPTISKKIRNEIIHLFDRYSDTIWRGVETNFNYSITTQQAIIEDIGDYYKPKSFNGEREYVETSFLNDFVMDNYPYCVFDAIEFFEKYNTDNNYTNDVNSIFQKNALQFKMLGGKIESITEIIITVVDTINELGLKELVDKAMSLYNDKVNGDKQHAVEKLWDAFERLKTYYKSLDKKDSAKRVIEEMCHGNSNFRELFTEEFNKLTTIGNNYRIRHHETNKTDIIDDSYYDYLFCRCSALIKLALKFLK